MRMFVFLHHGFLLQVRIIHPSFEKQVNDHWQIEDEAQWPPFRSRHFQMHFPEWKYMNISIDISLNFVPKGPINNIPALVQIMAWRLPGDKPSSEPMIVSLSTHICVTRPHWVNLVFNHTHGNWLYSYFCVVVEAVAGIVVVIVVVV